MGRLSKELLSLAAEVDLLFSEVVNEREWDVTLFDVTGEGTFEVWEAIPSPPAG